MALLNLVLRRLGFKFKMHNRWRAEPQGSQDSPPAHRHILNYWQQKATLAAKSSATAPTPSPLTVEPPSLGEIMLGDSPLQRLAPPATWAPQRAVLTTPSNKIKQKQGKRRLAFEKPEVSGEEDEETIYSQTKKCAGMEDNSSMVPLLEVVRRGKEDDMDFVAIVNRPRAKPWMPLRELAEDVSSWLVRRQTTTADG
ncbi:uncharacterized protein LOC120354818 [Nilaparvata lugens]|uniref:uncharacterized protein LOC120354818 n=1 Tax=Nilaparvata lugens TaxID=108931 RepID=UPI00193C95A4|nr:uncharacterized protein LOC120354818 [Nilaparvata lugens]XP_039298586.1 uncharacterized protein LOC120354818 [Nilaparvata lugens]XP_039298587.1 uncharacterized protein LOC120354818 [Nilaparvata lugens]XP_039298588.1 uncharacterized protein LOC120354818 [Nilaparvata lugens]